MGSRIVDQLPQQLSPRIADAAQFAIANRVLLVRDGQDIRGVILRSEAKLDWQIILREVEMLSQLKEEPEILTRLIELRTNLTRCE